VVVDSSALVAILRNEPERRRFNELIEADQVRLISAGTVLEASIVLEARGGEAAGRELDLFLHRSGFETRAFNQEQAETARSAFRRFGRGVHPAKLNFGDCFSYALSKTSGEPLLYKGGDFSKTDVEAVVRD
jgi:ribonuclease VapC